MITTKIKLKARDSKSAIPLNNTHQFVSLLGLVLLCTLETGAANYLLMPNGFALQPMVTTKSPSVEARRQFKTSTTITEPGVVLKEPKVMI